MFDILRKRCKHTVSQNTRFNIDPPFREARLKIGKQYLLGAVEIHVNSSGWYSHHHEGNPDYNEVVLHVVLYHNGQRGIKRQDGQIVQIGRAHV